MKNIFTTVKKLRDLGLCIIPSGGGHSGKAPSVKWRAWQDKVPNEQQIRSWQQTKKPPLWGIVTNSTVAVVDADTPEARARLTAEMEEPHVITPRGGAHWILIPQITQ